MRNYNILIVYCTAQVNTYNDAISKYCLQRLLNPQYRLTLTVIKDVSGEMTLVCEYFQKSSLTIIEVFQFVKAKICKIRSQCFEETVRWIDTVKEVLNSIDCNMDKTVILRFVELLYNNLEKIFLMMSYWTGKHLTNAPSQEI